MIDVLVLRGFQSAGSRSVDPHHDLLVTRIKNLKKQMPNVLPGDRLNPTRAARGHG
jgi:hypothetical protein